MAIENPSAFPMRIERGAPLGGFEEHPGMTLRDWFAGQALAAFIQSGDMNGIDTAEVAYAFADAMLAERAK